jgi:hypothetical protein
MIVRRTFHGRFTIGTNGERFATNAAIRVDASCGQRRDSQFNSIFDTRRLEETSSSMTLRT